MEQITRVSFVSEYTMLWMGRRDDFWMWIVALLRINPPETSLPFEFNKQLDSNKPRLIKMVVLTMSEPVKSIQRYPIRGLRIVLTTFSIMLHEVFFNKPKDLLMWKKVNRQRREATLLVSVVSQWKIHEDPDVQKDMIGYDGVSTYTDNIHQMQMVIYFGWWIWWFQVPSNYCHIIPWEWSYLPRKQARDELFKDSQDENREQGVYKTDLIKMRILGQRWGVEKITTKTTWFGLFWYLMLGMIIGKQTRKIDGL